MLKYLFIAAVLLSACGPDAATMADEKIDAVVENAESITLPDTFDGVQSFGDRITPEGAIPVNALAEKLGDADEMTVKVTGLIEDVCQKKGCWMNVYTNEAKDDPIFVKFKDYAYFMPLDAAGKQVIMEGVAKRETTPVDELRHYAEDKGASAEEIAAITEPETKVNFLASGVLLLPETGDE